ncbi:hypothetical protein SAMN05877753_11036 [Bacillus oleivorans]|uniref:Spore coat protein B n=1 Tax=Bacillus oleivorans TaxID=1448271 RepID=A0A285D4U4_9BACI|nr:hypothetical protein [Bacillus oleivorans]SNX74715.1 hypothetical protein SAMN05877753_11036 [Bacillus oleivorans]
MEQTHLLNQLVGRYININNKGPESMSGMVLGVNSDFIALQNDEGSVKYVRLYHVKSFTENVKTAKKMQNAQAEYVEAKSFSDLLSQYRYKWVNVHSGGPDKFEGILENVSDDSLYVVTKENYIQIPLHHVRSIDFEIESEDNNSKENSK